VSNSPLQRIADLEAQVAALTAENNALKAKPNGNGHLDAERLLDVVGLRIDRSGQLLREDFTGKLAGLISPYIDKTLRQCEEVASKQEDLEKKFEEHRKAVAGSAAELEAAFVKLRKEAAKDWKAQRDLIQDDFGQVDKFAKWFRGELQAAGKQLGEAVTGCNLAARACHEAAKGMDVPVEQSLERLGKAEARSEKVINQAAQRLTKAYEDLREPVLWRATALVLVVALVCGAFAVVTVWGTRRAIDANWQELAEHSERQKQEMKGLLDKALEEQKEAQVDREIKVKMWDELMKLGTPQQRQELLQKLREQVRKAGDKRLDEQMQAGYEQMNGKRK
jgi:hypothetical protein